MTTYLPSEASCTTCGFTTRDIHLLANHSCDVQAQGGRCEDYPCCGHELGDCNGEKYGSDEAIKAYAMEHSTCDHENGYCEVQDRIEEAAAEAAYEAELDKRERDHMEDLASRGIFI